MLRFASAPLPALLASFALASIGQAQVRPEMTVRFGYDNPETGFEYHSTLESWVKAFDLEFQDPTWDPLTNSGERAGAWVILATHAWVDLPATHSLFDTYPMLLPIEDPVQIRTFAENEGFTVEGAPSSSWLDWTQVNEHGTQKLRVQPDTLNAMLQYAMTPGEHAGQFGQFVKEWGQHVPNNTESIGWKTFVPHWVPQSIPGVILGISGRKWNPTFHRSEAGSYTTGRHLIGVHRLAEAAIIEQDPVLGPAFLQDEFNLDWVLDRGLLHVTIQPIILRSSGVTATNVTPEGYLSHGMAPINTTGPNDVFFAPDIDIAVSVSNAPPPGGSGGSACTYPYELESAAPGFIGASSGYAFIALGWKLQYDTARVGLNSGSSVDLPLVRLDPTGGLAVVLGYPDNANGSIELLRVAPGLPCPLFPLSISPGTN